MDRSPRPYVLEVLIPRPPAPSARSRRWTASSRVVGSYSSLQAAKKAAARHAIAYGPAEGLRVSKGGRGVWSWYQFHGPLGHMDRGYAANLVAHPSDCPRCEAIRTAEALLWPGRMPWSPELRSLSWEAKERLGAAAPFHPDSSERYARMGWTGP